MDSKKRPRPTLSCLSCKRKKLKCDRTFPCHQCSRLGRGKECSYEDSTYVVTQPSSTPTQNTPSQQDAILDLQNRMAAVEQRLGTSNGLLSSNTISPSGVTIEKVKYQCNLSKKGSSTRFHSHLSWKAMGSEFEDVRDFIAQFGEPKLQSVREDFVILQKISKEKARGSVSHQYRSATEIEDKMKCMIPERSVCNSLVGNFLNTFNHIFPSFDEEDLHSQLELRWQDLGVQENDFLPQLLAVITLGSRFESNTSSPVENVSLLESWLSGMKGKKRLRLPVVRVAFLLVLIKLAVPMRSDELWLETGTLLNLAMAVGLHHDPSEFGLFTPTEAETRRFLWFSIAELCFQSAMNCSMPFMLNESQWTCLLPAKRTPLAESFSSRCEIWNKLVEMDELIDKQALFTRLGPISSLLEDFCPPDFTNSSPAPIFIYHVQKILLGRLIAYGYRQLAFENRNDKKAIDAREYLKEICLDLLALQDVWDPEISDFNQQDSFNYWNMYHTFFRDDIIRSIIYLCLCIRIQKSQQVPISLSRSPGKFSDLDSPQISRIVESSIDALSRRLGGADMMKDVKAVICLSIIHACVRSTVAEQEVKVSTMEQAFRRALRKCREKLNETTDANRSSNSDPTEISTPAPVSTEVALDHAYIDADLMGFPNAFEPNLVDFQFNTDDWLFDI